MLNKYGIDCSVIKGKEERLALLNSRKPVSYTHLDVYKRQPVQFVYWQEDRRQNHGNNRFQSTRIPFLLMNPSFNQ